MFKYLFDKWVSIGLGSNVLRAQHQSLVVNKDLN